MFVTMLWAFVLIFTSKYNKAKKVLGIFMFIVFLLFVTHFIYYNGLKSYYLPFDILFVFCSLVIYPLYYLYIKVLTQYPDINLKDYLLFLPAFLQVSAVSLVYVLMDNNVRTIYVDKYLFGNGLFAKAQFLIKVQLILVYILQMIYFLQIMILSIKISKSVRAYNFNIENYYSNIDKKTIKWHKYILYSFLIVSLLSVFYNFLGRAFFSQSVLVLALPSITYSVLLFVFGYLGNLQNYNVSDFYVETNIDNGSLSEMINDSSLGKIPLEKTALYKLIMDIKVTIELAELYKIPDLKITDIAKKLNTNRTYVSKAINAHCNCSFNMFVNKFRIEQAKCLLSDDKNNKFSLEHIATLCGFANLHTFIRVFKDIENITPGKYRIISQDK